MKTLTSVLLALSISAIASLSHAASPDEPSSVVNINCLKNANHPLCQMQADTDDSPKENQVFKGSLTKVKKKASLRRF